MTDNGSIHTVVFVVHHIYRKKGHITICYHRNNLSYQGNSPPSFHTAMTAQTHIESQNVPVHEFSNGEV